MQFNRLLREKRLEIRYLIVGELLILSLLAFSSSNALAGAETQVMGWLQAAAEVGVVGLFLMALISNAVPVINIPYMLVALTYVIVNDSPAHVLAFTLATGIGSSIGKIAAYVLAARVATRFESLAYSPLSRRISDLVTRRPRFAPLLVFAGAGTVLPLDAALMPLVLVNYPARRVWLPLTVGKCLQSASLALGALYAFNLAGDSAGLKVDLTFGILLATLLLAAYQVEKAKTAQLEPVTA
jgi:hypothetical protein